MKICKNCHYFFEHPSKIQPQCMYKKEYSIDIVHGTTKWLNCGNYISCETSRGSKLYCGYEAKWFKKKEVR